MQKFTARALLFDMDGTLVESTANVEKIWSMWCNKHNINANKVIKICHGVRSQEVIAQVAPHLDIIKEVEWLDRIEIELSKESKEIPGAQHMFNQLNGSKFAIVTSASTSVAKARLSACDISIPEILIGSDSIKNGKPNPEPYLLAASMLNVEVNDCIVFEDAYAGIISAISAGMKVVQIGGDKPLSQEVSTIIQNWHQIKELAVGDLIEFKI